MKLIILICEDKAEHRGWMKSSLINTPPDYGYIAERKKLAENHFEIHSFELVGSAIKSIKEGLKPDLAIIDIDFQNVSEEQAKRNNLDIKIEKTRLRGFDLVEALKKYSTKTVNIIFTGHSTDYLEIDHELEKRKLEYRKDWFAKSSKGDGGTEVFAKKMPFLLKKCAEKFFQNLSNSKKAGLKMVLDGLNEKLLLEFTPEVNGRRMKIGNLLMGWSKATQKNGKLKLSYDDPHTIFSQLLNIREFIKFKPAGIWKEEYIEKILKEYENDPEYLSEKEEIDKKAAQVIFDICNCITLGNSIKVRVRIEDFNCQSLKNVTSFKKNDGKTIEYRTKLKNSLILRRALIGIAKVRDNKKTKFRRPDVIDLVASSTVYRNTSSPDNMKQFFNVALGLRGSIAKAASEQKVKYYFPHILEEENDWLLQYVPIIEDKLQRQDESSFLYD